MVAASMIGLSVGKWVHNIGGVFMLIVFAALLILPFIGLATGHLHEYHPFRTEMPAVSLFNLNILGKLGFGALGGFEYVAILAGETRSPARSVGRSVLIAAPIIAIMFVLGTSTVVAYIPRDQIDLIGPMPQVLRVGFGPFGIAGPLVTIAILMTLGMRIAQVSVSFTAVTRLPMVAGWDRLLPAWFSQLHSKYRTPVNSILLVGVVAFGIGLVSMIGVGQAEAFQLLWNAGGMFYALTYVVMFAVPIFGLRGVTPRPPLWLKSRVVVGAADDGALRGAVGLPDHRGEERDDVRVQDLARDSRGERHRHRSVRLGPPACVEYRGHGGVGSRAGLEQQLLYRRDAEDAEDGRRGRLRRATGRDSLVEAARGASSWQRRPPRYFRLTVGCLLPPHSLNNARGIGDSAADKCHRGPNTGESPLLTILFTPNDDERPKTDSPRSGS